MGQRSTCASSVRISRCRQGRVEQQERPAGVRAQQADGGQAFAAAPRDPAQELGVTVDQTLGWPAAACPK